MNVNFLQVAIAVEDLDRAVAWWAEIFGSTMLARTRVEEMEADLAWVQGPGLKLELIQAGDMLTVPELQVNSPADRRVIGAKAITLETDDVPALLDELESKGVTIVWRDLHGTGGIHDSEGNLMTIFPRPEAQTLSASGTSASDEAPVGARAF